MNRREMKVSNFLHMQYLTPIKKKFFFQVFSLIVRHLHISTQSNVVLPSCNNHSSSSTHT